MSAGPVTIAISHLLAILISILITYIVNRLKHKEALRKIARMIYDAADLFNNGNIAAKILREVAWYIENEKIDPVNLHEDVKKHLKEEEKKKES